MAIPLTAVFTLDVDEIVETAFARIGGESIQGEEARKAKRALSLMLLDWSNRGLPLWARERCVLPLVKGVGRYALPADTIDVLQAVTREPSGMRLEATLSSMMTVDTGSPLVTVRDADHGAQVGESVAFVPGFSVAGIDFGSGVAYEIQTVTTSTYVLAPGTAATSSEASAGGTVSAFYTGYGDIELGRINSDEYARLPNKGITGRPSLFYVERNVSTPYLYVYPCNDATARQIVYWRKRRLADVNALTDNVDVPDRFLPALVSGLAYELSWTRPVPQELRAEIKARADEEFARAFSEDRDRAALSIVPDMGGYFR